MSVSCDILVGYSIDIMNELKTLSEKDKDRVLDTSDPDIDYTSYSSNDSIINKVTILYDGMNGEYCKLMYVRAVAKHEGNGAGEGIISNLNEILESADIPFSIKQKIKNVYKAKFNTELNRTSRIHAEYVEHWY